MMYKINRHREWIKDYLDDYIEAMIDAIEQGENIDKLVALVFPEKIDQPIVKQKLIKLK